MSLNLYWEPVAPTKRHNLGGQPLKGLLCRAFGEGDGSLRTDFRLTGRHVEPLRMLQRTAGTDGPQASLIWDGLDELIEAIEKYGAIDCCTDE